MSQKSNVPMILCLEPLQVKIYSSLPSKLPTNTLEADNFPPPQENFPNYVEQTFSPVNHFLTHSHEDSLTRMKQRPKQKDHARAPPIQIEWIGSQYEEEMRSSKFQQQRGDSNQDGMATRIRKKPSQEFYFQLAPNQKRPQLMTPRLEKVNVAEEFEDLGIRGSESSLANNRQKCLLEEGGSEEERVLIQGRREFLKGPRLSNLRLQLSRNVPPKETLVMTLAKSSHLLSYFWPQFQLRFKNDQKPLLAGKRTSFNPYSTYVISTSPNDFDLRSSSYIGKVKTNLLGTVVNIFGPGLSPSAAAKQHEIPRELLATIVYLKVEAQAPRHFTLFVKKQQFHYYLAFPQVKLYGPEIPLNELYKDPAVRSKIKVYTNRIPVFDPKTKTNILDFRGKVQCPSVRNFILEDECGQEVMLLGKSRDNHFNVEISHPLSALVGFGVTLSSFESLWL